MLKSDPVLYKRPPPPRHTPPPLLELDANSSCPCSAHRDFYDPAAPTVTRAGRLYTITHLLAVDVQVQRCPSARSSRRRFIGPDLREAGIFNYNNSTLVSHELLDEYTMAYTTSETPFNSFVALVSLRYAMSGCVFMGEDLFRSVWFAYVDLQAYENDMTCNKCGVHPETTIWDGVTVAFGQKHVTGNLVPPTTKVPGAVTRSKTRNQPKQKLIQDIVLRRQLRQALERPDVPSVLGTTRNGLEAMETGSDREGDSDADETQAEEQAARLKEYFCLLDKVSVGLAKECPALAGLFGDICGASAMIRSKRISSSYTSFFKQV